ncbi:hypothetical protein HQ590_06980 [bacterium]|nr:hypothetical protein [bacterium]
MKSRQRRGSVKVKKVKLSARKRRSPLRRTNSRRSVRRNSTLLKTPKPLSLLQRIAAVTEELQMLRSRLANAGDDLPAVGVHRIGALEAELERLWEMRRREQAAPLRETALTEEEEKILAFPSGSRSRGM